MSPRSRAVLSGVAVAILFSLPLIPEILGTRRLVFRDAHMTHWPWRRVAMKSLAAGQVPFVNESASGGQPFLANPNAALLYPTFLLETVLPAASAFNLHYLLHVLWAYFGARALARRLGLSAGPAHFAGIAFAFSGMMLSYGSAFMNSSAAAAWLPWCAAATLDLTRARSSREALSGAAAAAIAFGLQLLAGEPALSLLSILFAAFLGAHEIVANRERAARSSGNLLAGGLMAGVMAGALASPVLLPLSDVLSHTYRGQHLYSERAFSASPFALWRTIEWFFPRFGGDPGALGVGAHWQYDLHAGDMVYIWCVGFGVIPLLAILLGALRREFWSRRVVWLAAGAAVSFLFSLGSALPLYRLLFSVDLLRRLRYPIKFYLLTTLCVALLAGFAAQRWTTKRGGGREAGALMVLSALYAVAILLAGRGGMIEGWIEPLVRDLAVAPSLLLPAIRRSLQADAIFGLAGAAVLSLAVFSRRPKRGRAHLLGFATLLLALPWGLPLFVHADEKDLTRPPGLLPALTGPGRLYISPALPEFALLFAGTAHPQLEPRLSRLARVQIEELIPATGAPFGVRYLFDADPDGSYGWFNRIASEAVSASLPAERERLLRVGGARWALEAERERFPGFRPVTGLTVAGRRLVLSEIPEPLPEIRWAGREYRRRSLSETIELVRSEKFLPAIEVVLPGRAHRDAGPGTSFARLSIETVSADRAAVAVQPAAPGHVVFSRTYFPAWKARLDGAPVPVLVANARDLAVAVPAGFHRVEFEYDRRPFVRGVILQVTAFLLLLAASGAFPKLLR